MKKPNIMFIFADDQRYDTIQALGNKEIMTPNLDALVKEGTAFTQCHIPSGTSSAVCMPSRAMLHTGRKLFGLDKEGQTIPEEHTLLGEYLKDSGYETFGTGKWHNGVASYVRSFTDGDEIFFGGMDDHWAVPAYHFDPSGKYEERRYKIKNYMHDCDRSTFISDHISDQHSTDLFGKAVRCFVKKSEKNEKPFFAYVSFMAPHDPRTMPDRFRKMYDIEQISLPENFMQYHSIEYGNTECRDEMLAPYPRTSEDTKQQILEYYAMISHIDEQVGEIINSLKETNQYENTIIVYTADNGLALGQHGLFGKQCHYDHSVRVPFIISGPGIPKNQTSDAYIYLMDIFPTLCNLLDLEIPESVQGRSFKNAIFDYDLKGRETLYFAYMDKIRSIKDRQFKLMEHVHDGVRTTQLFDLTTDQSERTNLAGLSAYKAVVDYLRELMKEYRDDWNEEAHRYGQSYWSQYEA